VAARDESAKNADVQNVGFYLFAFARLPLLKTKALWLDFDQSDFRITSTEQCA
jgi:hypothetical protein